MNIFLFIDAWITCICINHIIMQFADNSNYKKELNNWDLEPDWDMLSYITTLVVTGPILSLLFLIAYFVSLFYEPTKA